MPVGTLEATLPNALVERLLQCLPTSIVRVQNVRRGLAPGIRCILTLADGSKRFLKAVSDQPNAKSPLIFAREARVNFMLPKMCFRPNLVLHLRDNRWELLLFEHVAGSEWKPQARKRLLNLVVDLVLRWVDNPLTAPTGIEPLADVESDLFRGWIKLCGAGTPVVSSWAARRLGYLCQLEEEAKTVLAGNTLVHGDLRIDNMLLGSDNSWILDWAWASRGSLLFDMLTFLNDCMIRAPAFCSRSFANGLLASRFPDEMILRGMAALAGFYVYLSSQPPVRGLPRLRPFQLRQARGFLNWLRHCGL